MKHVYLSVIVLCLSFSAIGNPLDDLFEAIESGNHRAFDQALRDGADVNGSNGKATPLHVAVAQGRLRMARTLLARGAAIDATDAHGRTPLHLAAALHDDLELVNLLLNRGANRQAINSNGNTPLHFAARANHLLVFCRLILAGADPFARDATRRTAIDLLRRHDGNAQLGENPPATQRIPSNVIPNVLRPGANIHEQDARGRQAIHFAAELGNLDVLFVLLRRGAHIDAVDNEGNTPLLVAARNGHFVMCLFLIANGANVDTRNARGLTFYAILGAHVDQRMRETILRLLPERDHNGMTAVHAAVLQNRVEVIDDLADQGADLEFPDNLGLTPLHYAANDGLENVMAALLRRGVRVNRRSPQGMIPLHLAARWGHPNAIVLLIAHGAELHAEDNRHRTPWLLLGHHARLRDEAFARFTELGNDFHAMQPTEQIWQDAFRIATVADAQASPRLTILETDPNVPTGNDEVITNTATRRLTPTTVTDATPMHWLLGLLNPNAQTLFAAFVVVIIDKIRAPQSGF